MFFFFKEINAFFYYARMHLLKVNLVNSKDIYNGIYNVV